MVHYCFPAYGHPDGPSNAAWFRVVDGRGFETWTAQPGYPSRRASGLSMGGLYPTLGFPGDPPSFHVVGSFVYERRGGGPWFRVEQRAT